MVFYYYVNGALFNEHYMAAVQRKVDELNDGDCVGLHVWCAESILRMDCLKELFEYCSSRLFEVEMTNLTDACLMALVDVMSMCPRLTAIHLIHGERLTKDSVIPLFRQLQSTNVMTLGWSSQLYEDAAQSEEMTKEFIRVAPNLKLTWLYVVFGDVIVEFIANVCRACARMPKLRELDMMVQGWRLVDNVNAVIDSMADMYRLDEVRMSPVWGMPEELYNKLQYAIKRYIRPGIPQLLTLCQAQRFGKVENGKQVCAVRRLPVDLLRTMTPMLVPQNEQDVETKRCKSRSTTNIYVGIGYPV